MKNSEFIMLSKRKLLTSLLISCTFNIFSQKLIGLLKNNFFCTIQLPFLRRKTHICFILYYPHYSYQVVSNST